MTVEERAARYGHRGAELAVRAELLDAVERALFASGAHVVRLRSEDTAVAGVLREAGVLLLHESVEDGIWLDGKRVEGGSTAEDVLRALRESGVLVGEERGSR